MQKHHLVTTFVKKANETELEDFLVLHDCGLFSLDECNLEKPFLASSIEGPFGGILAQLKTHKFM